MTLNLDPDADLLDPSFSTENRLMAIAHALEQCSTGGMVEAAYAEIAGRWKRARASFTTHAIALCEARRKELLARPASDPARSGQE